MRLMDKVKEFLGNFVEKKKKEDNEVNQQQGRAYSPHLPCYTNQNVPMTVEEMYLMVPADICFPGNKKHKAVFELIQNMSRFLEESRIISKQALDRYKNLPDGVNKQIRIRGIQEQMSAVRFRLDVCDYKNILEMEILKNKLYELYQVAKEVDPEGVSRYERMIDKKMKRAR